MDAYPVSRLIPALLVLFLLLPPTAAFSQSRSIERPIETETALLILPQDLPGLLLARPCEQDCAPLSLQLDRSSRFFLGTRELSWGEFRTLSRSTRASAVVLFSPENQTVTRIIISR